MPLPFLRVRIREEPRLPRPAASCEDGRARGGFHRRRWDAVQSSTRNDSGWRRVSLQYSDGVDSVGAKSVGKEMMMAAITVSRQLGSGGATIARAVAAELGFHLLDRELVDLVARQLPAAPEATRLLDERAYGWATSVVFSVLQALRGQQVTPETYNFVAAQVIREAAKVDDVVISDAARRSCWEAARNFPRSRRHVAFAERVTGSPRETTSITGRGPTACQRERRRARAGHARTLGQRDWHDPLLYDLVLNTDRISPAAGAGVVVAAARLTGILPSPALGHKVGVPATTRQPGSRAWLSWRRVPSTARPAATSVGLRPLPSSPMLASPRPALIPATPSQLYCWAAATSPTNSSDKSTLRPSSVGASATTWKSGRSASRKDERPLLRAALDLDTVDLPDARRAVVSG